MSVTLSRSHAGDVVFQHGRIRNGHPSSCSPSTVWKPFYQPLFLNWIESLPCYSPWQWSCPYVGPQKVLIKGRQNFFKAHLAKIMCAASRYLPLSVCIGAYTEEIETKVIFQQGQHQDCFLCRCWWALNNMWGAKKTVDFHDFTVLMFCNYKSGYYMQHIPHKCCF